MAPVEFLHTYPVLVVVLCLLALRTIAYLYYAGKYHYAHRSTSWGQIPPQYPALIPYLPFVAAFIWDTRKAVERFTYSVCNTLITVHD
jgi:hypothetical protein